MPEGHLCALSPAFPSQPNLFQGTELSRSDLHNSDRLSSVSRLAYPSAESRPDHETAWTMARMASQEDP